MFFMYLCKQFSMWENVLDRAHSAPDLRSYASDNVRKVAVANFGGSRSVMQLLVVFVSLSRTIILYVRSQQLIYKSLLIHYFLSN